MQIKLFWLFISLGLCISLGCARDQTHEIELGKVLPTPKASASTAERIDEKVTPILRKDVAAKQVEYAAGEGVDDPGRNRQPHENPDRDQNTDQDENATDEANVGFEMTAIVFGWSNAASLPDWATMSSDEKLDRLANDSQIAKKIRSGDIKIRWELVPSVIDRMYVPSSEVIVAYQACAPTSGGWVGMADGTRRRVNAATFRHLLDNETAHERRMATLKSQAAQILAGKSTKLKVECGSQVLRVGDTATIKMPKWVDALPSSLKADERLSNTNSFQSFCIQSGGTIKVLGFADDETAALVEYTPPSTEIDSESRPQFFIDRTDGRFVELEQNPDDVKR